MANSSPESSFYDRARFLRACFLMKKKGCHSVDTLVSGLKYHFDVCIYIIGGHAGCLEHIGAHITYGQSLDETT